MNCKADCGQNPGRLRLESQGGRLRSGRFEAASDSFQSRIETVENCSSMKDAVKGQCVWFETNSIPGARGLDAKDVG